MGLRVTVLRRESQYYDTYVELNKLSYAYNYNDVRCYDK